MMPQAWLTWICRNGIFNNINHHGIIGFLVMFLTVLYISAYRITSENGAGCFKLLSLQNSWGHCSPGNLVDRRGWSTPLTIHENSKTFPPALTAYCVLSCSIPCTTCRCNVKKKNRETNFHAEGRQSRCFSLKAPVKVTCEWSVFKWIDSSF